jgi:hypothetical protein
MGIFLVMLIKTYTLAFSDAKNWPFFVMGESQGIW